jgi:hypothetical protein
MAPPVDGRCKIPHLLRIISSCGTQQLFVDLPTNVMTPAWGCPLPLPAYPATGRLATGTGRPPQYHLQPAPRAHAARRRAAQGKRTASNRGSHVRPALARPPCRHRKATPARRAARQRLLRDQASRAQPRLAPRPRCHDPGCSDAGTH